jgi:hypothetical protein
LKRYESNKVVVIPLKMKNIVGTKMAHFVTGGKFERTCFTCSINTVVALLVVELTLLALLFI